MTDTQWRLEGKWLEYCSCDYGCPCESMADPTQGHCTGAVAFKIDKGHYGDLSLDGLVVAATFYFPRAIHHGQGRGWPDCASCLGRASFRSSAAIAEHVCDGDR